MPKFNPVMNLLVEIMTIVNYHSRRMENNFEFDFKCLGIVFAAKRALLC